MIEWVEDCWTIRDLGSSNGTQVNGVKVQRGAEGAGMPPQHTVTTTSITVALLLLVALGAPSRSSRWQSLLLQRDLSIRESLDSCVGSLHHFESSHSCVGLPQFDADCAEQGFTLVKS